LQGFFFPEASLKSAQFWAFSRVKAPQGVPETVCGATLWAQISGVSLPPEKLTAGSTKLIP
jgi:hypothetical protein